MVSVVHPLSVLTNDEKHTKQMEEEEAQDFIRAVGGWWCCCVGGGVLFEITKVSTVGQRA